MLNLTSYPNQKAQGFLTFEAFESLMQTLQVIGYWISLSSIASRQHIHAKPRTQANHAFSFPFRPKNWQLAWMITDCCSCFSLRDPLEARSYLTTIPRA